MDLSDKNYYEILDISTNASPEEIHRGYIQAKNAYGPDSVALYSLISKEECNTICELIEEAYSILSIPNKKVRYDQARGLNQESNERIIGNDLQKTETYGSSTGQNEFQINSAEDSTREMCMSKIVAKKKFALDYVVDPEFERKIEDCTEFTGEFLKQIREYKNVDLPRLTEMTKVSKTFLRHLENEEIDKLPALVYIRGFIYQYAKCLKLNPDLVATSFFHRIKKMKGES